MRNLLELDLKPSQIMTKRAFENAFRIVIVLGRLDQRGLHLWPWPAPPSVEMTLDDFRASSRRRRCWPTCAPAAST
jgi:dihydroxy-acid dehydratase